MVPARVLRTALTIAAALSLVSPEIARAQSDEGGGHTPPEAVEFYRVAREQYEAGQYREASESLERALVLDPDSPTLVYNLARVYELLGELDEALEMYQRYQRLLPQQQAREQERAEGSIRRLEGAQSSGQLGGEAPPEAVEPLRQLPGLVLVRENGVADSAFWVVLASGVFALAVGGVVGGLALGRHDEATGFVLNGSNTLQQREDAFAEAGVLGAVADASFGIGGAAVIVAGLLYFLREQTVERAPIQSEEESDEAARLDVGVEVGPIVSPAQIGVQVGGRL